MKDEQNGLVEVRKKGALMTWKVWKTGTDMDDIKVDESILPVFKCEPDIWDEKT